MPDQLVELALRARASAERPVVIIDGRSGSGKTTLAAALAPLIDGAQVVGLDDVYPGWSGLAAASQIVVETILRPVDPGYHRWDWELSRPSAWRRLDPHRPLVIEGAGSLTPASAAQATLRVWVELDEATRRARVAGRSDAVAYAPWWSMWARQEAAHLAAADPRSLADVVLDQAQPSSWSFSSSKP
ncbi:adenylate kinase [Frondihabitans sucicola]|uniref:Adenylate kinase n=1 Tax=Frondihabitans sucicola TaxID=1268041 RepID=A0ABN6XYC6_9MICO|nr:ATP-binding protein [Frondihabitans sucicola]BDZ49946.1 adenylate kinase [Frondihabitans sucicola]